MDPVTVVGGVAAIAQIAVYCMKSIQTLEHLRIKYRDGSILLDSLYKESHLIHASLLELDELFHDDKNMLSAALRSKPKLFTNLERTLSACDNVYQCLDRELLKLAGTADILRTTRMITKEKVLQEYLVQINSHKNTLTLLIQGIQMHSLNMIIEILTFNNPMIRHMVPNDAIQDARQGSNSSRSGYFYYDPGDANAYPTPRTLIGSSPSVGQGIFDYPSSSRAIAGSSSSPLSKAETRKSSLIAFDEKEVCLPPPALKFDATAGAPQLAPISTDADDFGDAFKIVVSPTETARPLSPISPLSAASEDTDKIVISVTTPPARTNMGPNRARSRSSIATIATTTSITSLERSTDNAASYFPSIANRPGNVPIPLDELFTTLDGARRAMMSSSNPLESLRWAEDVFNYIAFVGKKPRISPLTGKASAINKDLSPLQQALENDAKIVVEDLANLGDGKALYLKARWCTSTEADKIGIFLEAYKYGNLRAAARVGATMQTGSQADTKTAVGYLYQGQRGGDAMAGHRLAEAYLIGDLGLKKNHREAVQLLRLAAQRVDVDYTESAFRLAELQTQTYRKEISKHLKISKSDLPIDEASALQNYLLAAYYRHPKALLKIGLAYQAGTFGLPINAAYSLHYLHLASQAGEFEADSAISNWFWFGEGTTLEANPELAFKFARKAAEMGYVPAYCQVGYFLETGFGIPARDMGKARDWYLRGAAAGDPAARKRLDALISRMRI